MKSLATQLLGSKRLATSWLFKQTKPRQNENTIYILDRKTKKSKNYIKLKPRFWDFKEIENFGRCIYACDLDKLFKLNNINKLEEAKFLIEL